MGVEDATKWKEKEEEREGEGLTAFLFSFFFFQIPASIHFQTIPGKQKALVPGLTFFFFSFLFLFSEREREEGGLKGIEDGNCG